MGLVETYKYSGDHFPRRTVHRDLSSYQLVYAGLHYDRDLVLGRLIQSIQQVHRNYRKNISIYLFLYVNRQDRVAALDTDVAGFTR